MTTALMGGDTRAGSAGPLSSIDPALRSILARTALNGLNVIVGRYGQAIANNSVTENCHSFLFATDPNMHRSVSGRIVGGHQMFHIRPHTRTIAAAQMDMPWAFGLVTVPLGQLDAHGVTMHGAEVAQVLSEDRMIAVRPAAMARLTGLIKDIGRVVRDAQWILHAPAPVAALEGSLTEALLGCITQGLVTPDRAALRRHRQIVKRFEDVLRERPEEMLSLPAICAAVGVKERVLNLACQELIGKSAMQHARGYRLDLVRQRLLVSDPEATQVTKIAMHYGFWELGRFAQVYRSRFGELPSQTLRQGKVTHAI